MLVSSPGCIGEFRRTFSLSLSHPPGLDLAPSGLDSVATASYFRRVWSRVYVCVIFTMRVFFPWMFAEEIRARLRGRNNIGGMYIRLYKGEKRGMKNNWFAGDGVYNEARTRGLENVSVVERQVRSVTENMDIQMRVKRGAITSVR